MSSAAVLRAELRETSKALQRHLPGNIFRAENQRLARDIERTCAEYFEALAGAVPVERLMDLYLVHIGESAPADPRARAMARAATDLYGEPLRPIHDAFLARMAAHLGEGYILGSLQMTVYGHTKLGRPILFEGPPMREAITWAQRRGAALVTGVREETKRRIGGIVADGIAQKGGVEGIARDLRRTFQEMGRGTEMSASRASTIARTESANALMEGSVSRARGMGVTGKMWIVTPYREWPCDHCADNERAGTIPIGDVFPSGDPHPPQHPNCACGLAYEMLPDAQEGG